MPQRKHLVPLPAYTYSGQRWTWKGQSGEGVVSMCRLTDGLINFLCLSPITHPVGAHDQVLGGGVIDGALPHVDELLSRKPAEEAEAGGGEALQAAGAAVWG